MRSIWKRSTLCSDRGPFSVGNPSTPATAVQKQANPDALATDNDADHVELDAFVQQSWSW